MTSVKVYKSSMKGAPALLNEWGSLIDILDACLVNGFAEYTCTLSNNQGLITATTSEPHGYSEYDVIQISGADQPEYNGEHRVISVLSSTTFTFTIAVSASTPSGNIKVKRPPLGFEKPFEGHHKAAYHSKNLESARAYLRVDAGIKPNNGFGVYNTAWTKFANVGVVETMTSIDDLSGHQAPWDPSNPALNWTRTKSDTFGICVWIWARPNSTYLNNIVGAPSGFAYDWVIIGDDRFFLFFVASAHNRSKFEKTVYAFGEINSYQRNDKFSTIISGLQLQGSQIDYVGGRGDSSLARTHDWNGNYIHVNSMNSEIGAKFMSSVIGNSSSMISGVDGRPRGVNPANRGYILSRFYMYEGEVYGWRGEIPGLRFLMNSIPVSDGLIIDGTIHDQDRKFMAVNFASNNSAEIGTVFVDITGPWR